MISADGRIAAMVTGAAAPAVELLDLATGAARTLTVSVGGESLGQQSMAWSPQAPELFVIGDRGDLFAIDARTDATTDLTLATRGVVPQLLQLAVRPAQ